MKIVIFGLTISSSWGNGHATLLRGLFRALVARGHRIIFFERDVPYYAAHRDLTELEGCELILYTDWPEALPPARKALDSADVGMVTSYCPDGRAASELVLSSKVPLRAFYDLDTPVTLESLRAGQTVSYLPPQGLGDFDFVLSYTGGAALSELQTRLGARHVAPLYGSVDPDVHRPVAPVTAYEADISYLGTYAEDRQAALEELFIEPARRNPQYRFLIGGSKYPENFPWTANINYVQHVPPPAHPSFYCSSPMTLSVTRRAMAEMGFCPSGRLFEAAACGTPVVSDMWEGLEQFFTPGAEIIIVYKAGDVTRALALPREELARVARAARERVLDEHTATRRAVELEKILDATKQLPGDARLFESGQSVAEAPSGSGRWTVDSGQYSIEFN